MKPLATPRTNIKRKNRGQVLKLIATNLCSNRSDLVKHMGLTKMAITNIVTELTEKGLIEECGVDPIESVGRNPINLQVSPDAPKTIGILILRDRCEAVLCDFYLHILHRECVNLLRPTAEELTSIIFGLVENLLSHESNILGIGISSIGPIDFDRGMLLNPPYFFGIHDLPVAELLKEKYSLPVFMDHDNQSAALAELLYGNGRNADSFMVFGMARGVGCGIVKNGALYIDSEKLAPEVGHVSIDYKGEQCVCGSRGCLELYVNTGELVTRLRKATSLSYTFEEFCRLQDNKEVEAILTDAIEKISSALISTINLLNLDLILLGYDSVYFADRYIALLEERINQYKFARNRKKTEVRRTCFGTDSQLLGAACNVLSRVYEGELLLN